MRAGGGMNDQRGAGTGTDRHTSTPRERARAVREEGGGEGGGGGLMKLDEDGNDQDLTRRVVFDLDDDPLDCVVRPHTATCTLQHRLSLQHRLAWHV